MFLHLSVILFTGKGCFCPRVGALCPRGEGLCPGGFCPGGLCLVVSVQGGLSPRREISVQGDLRMVTCGRYASYWATFFFV